MALTISSAGSGNSTSSSATLAFDSGATWAQYDWIVVCIAADNSGTGGASSISSVTDAAGHTYTLRTTNTDDPGAANAGATLAIYTAEVGAAGMASTDDITVNFSPNTPSKAAHVYKVTPAASKRVSYVSASSVVAATITTGSLTSGQVVFGAAAEEDNSSITGDSDTSNGSWSTIRRTTATTFDESTSMQVASQYKAVTGTGTQTYNLSLTADFVIGYLVVEEITGGVSGTAAGTWGAWTATAAATIKHPATALGSWGAWLATVNAAISHTAVATGTWGAWTATASGGPVRYGTSDGTWGGWTGTAAAVVNHPSAAVGDWGAWLATVSAGISHTATATGTWGAWSATVAAGVSHTATAAGTWGAWAATGAATVSHAATAAGTWGAWAATGAGVTGRAGTATGTWGSWSGTVAPVVSHPAAAAAAWGGWAGTVSATVTPPVAAGGSRMLVYYAKRHRKKPSG